MFFFLVLQYPIFKIFARKILENRQLKSKEVLKELDEKKAVERVCRKKLF